MICLVYVDDCIFFARKGTVIEAMIHDLQKNFELTIEDDANAYLGISVCKDEESKKIHLTQTGLIDKILETTGMKDCNPNATPALVTPLGTDLDGAPRQDAWNYASVIGMLLYLASSTRADIQYAVHQCARFTHDPKRSHEEAVKRIC